MVKQALKDGLPAEAKATTAPEESRAKANYRRWKNVLKRCFGPQDRQRLWAGALEILDGDDRLETKARSRAEQRQRHE